MKYFLNLSEKRQVSGEIKKNQVLRFMKIKHIFILLCFVSFANIANAQEGNSFSRNFNANLSLKNMHTWHGGVVTPGVMMASSIEFKTTDNKFIAGLWGGASFDGSYKEFSYYATYKFVENFNLSLISHNNYSNSANPDIFSYDKHSSPNFVDIVLEYTVSDDVPLTAYWSTILFGNGGDYVINNNGKEEDSYSTYAELRYKFFAKENTNLSLFVGGAFSFVTEKTFYSQAANFTNLGIKLEQKVNLFSKQIPVTAMGFWNPESKIGVLELGISLF